jgi:hypothetical protein
VCSNGRLGPELRQRINTGPTSSAGLAGFLRHFVQSNSSFDPFKVDQLKTAIDDCTGLAGFRIATRDMPRSLGRWPRTRKYFSCH